MKKIPYWDLPRVLLVICFVLLLLAPFIWVASIQRGGLWGNLHIVLITGAILLGPFFAAFRLIPSNRGSVEREVENDWRESHDYAANVDLILGWGVESSLSPILEEFFF